MLQHLSVLDHNVVLLLICGVEYIALPQLLALLCVVQAMASSTFYEAVAALAGKLNTKKASKEQMHWLKAAGALSGKSNKCTLISWHSAK